MVDGRITARLAVAVCVERFFEAGDLFKFQHLFMCSSFRDRAADAYQLSHELAELWLNKTRRSRRKPQLPPLRTLFCGRSLTLCAAAEHSKIGPGICGI